MITFDVWQHPLALIEYLVLHYRSLRLRAVTYKPFVLRPHLMDISDDLLALDWPDSFVVAYRDGTSERLTARHWDHRCHFRAMPRTASGLSALTYPRNIRRTRNNAVATFDSSTSITYSMTAATFCIAFRSVTVAQQGFYAKPRLRRWRLVWFAVIDAPLSPTGFPRRGHRFFGNAVSFW